MALMQFVILGEPKGKGRPRFARVKTGAKEFVTTRTPADTVNYENLVKQEFHAQVNRFIETGNPVYFLVDMFYAIPMSASHKKRGLMIARELLPMKKPDWDNVGKIICDALNKVAFYDDSQIVDGRTRKFFSSRPRVEVFISTEEIDTKLIDNRRNTHEQAYAHTLGR